MKTSELKKWLDANDWIYQEEINCIIICAFTHVLVMKNSHGIEIKSVNIMRESGLDLLNKLIEYHQTPLNEREDEKKYKIELNEICEGVLSKEEMRTMVYSMSSRIQSTLHQKLIFKEVFTQSEVDNFPAEIKGAIECGFLRKVEVE